MRDVLLGFLTYTLSIAAFIGVILLCFWLFGPPTADRARSFAFIAGGGAMLFATILLTICVIIVVFSARS